MVRTTQVCGAVILNAGFTYALRMDCDFTILLFVIFSALALIIYGDD